MLTEMPLSPTPSDSPNLSQALAAADQTRCLQIGPGILRQTPRYFREQFGNQPALIVADTITFAVAGGIVAKAFDSAGHPTIKPFIFSSPDLYAEHGFVEQLESELRKHAAIPIAVGAGTINDLTKLAAHRTGRPYLCVATAASMDGYTAFGASITFQGSKQTFVCPAPKAVVADLEIISAAPASMNAAGYADLLAKVTAGADWLVADALAVEPLIPQAWVIIQGRLRQLLADPAGITARSAAAIQRLIEGLMLGGFAMQAAKSSRAASGAEHQFSHLWDMEHHTHGGQAPSHGFKVGIGTLAVTALYETFLEQPLENWSSHSAGWPELSFWEKEIRQRFDSEQLISLALAETQAKQPSADILHAQLERLRSIWPDLRHLLRRQLLPLAEVKRLLQLAGAPAEPEEIGISRPRLRDSFWKAYFVRRRFTILDVVVRTGMLEICLDKIFGPKLTGR
jgi:glycerol-1-phosphate dehydrogenase [NAD(P)+]